MVEHLPSMFDDRYGCPGYFSVFRCPGCQQLQTVPLLKDAELPALYGSYYPRRQIDIDALLRQIGEPGARRARMSRWWSGTDNQGQYAAKPGMTVLDYGCGAGDTVALLREDGFNAVGCDTFYAGNGHRGDTGEAVLAARKAAGIVCDVPESGDLPFPPGSFDVILSNQVLEHVNDLDATLARMTRVLAPGGLILHLEQPQYSDEMPLYEQFIRDWDSFNNNEPFWSAMHGLDLKKQMVDAGLPRDSLFVTGVKAVVDKEVFPESAFDEREDHGRAAVWNAYGAWKAAA